MTHPEIAEVPRRRESDKVIDHLHECVEDMKKQFTTLSTNFDTLNKEVAKNTEITNEVKDILKSFSLVGRAARWLGYVAGAVTALWALYTQIKTGTVDPSKVTITR
jgi:hypothetical protein